MAPKVDTNRSQPLFQEFQRLMVTAGLASSTEEVKRTGRGWRLFLDENVGRTASPDYFSCSDADLKRLFTKITTYRAGLRTSFTDTWDLMLDMRTADNLVAGGQAVFQSEDLPLEQTSFVPHVINQAELIDELNNIAEDNPIAIELLHGNKLVMIKSAEDMNKFTDIDYANYRFLMFENGTFGVALIRSTNLIKRTQGVAASGIMRFSNENKRVLLDGRPEDKTAQLVQPFFGGIGYQVEIGSGIIKDSKEDYPDGDDNGNAGSAPPVTSGTAPSGSPTGGKVASSLASAAGWTGFFDITLPGKSTALVDDGVPYTITGIADPSLIIGSGAMVFAPTTSFGTTTARAALPH